MKLNVDNKLISKDLFQREPKVVRSVLAIDELERFQFNRIKKDLRSEVKCDLYFHNLRNGNGSQRKRIPKSILLPNLMDKLSSEREEVIAYLFNFDQFNSDLSGLIDRFRVGYEYRYYSSLLSYSNKGSVIPSHVDYIDSIVVQFEGSREWKVWHNDILEDAQLRLINDDYKNGAFDLNKHETLMNFELHPGDILYLPALYGHEGITHDERSMSLSIGWTAYSPYRIIKEILPEVLDSNKAIEIMSNVNFFKPIPICDKPETYLDHYSNSIWHYIQDLRLNRTQFDLVMNSLDLSTLYEVPK